MYAQIAVKTSHPIKIEKSQRFCLLGENIEKVHPKVDFFSTLKPRKIPRFSLPLEGKVARKARRMRCQEPYQFALKYQDRHLESVYEYHHWYSAKP